MLTALKTFAQDESGATAIEYGLFTGFLAIGLTMFLSLIGSSGGRCLRYGVDAAAEHVPGASVQILPPDPA